MGDVVLGSGTGRSKKEAEQKAAELAWRAITARAEAAESSDATDLPAGSPS